MKSPNNAFAILVGAFAAGFLLGLAIPVTDLETERVGPLGEKIEEQARTAASDFVEQGKAAVVSAVTDALN